MVWIVLVSVVLLFAAGAAFGSFFNVVGIRLPVGQSVVLPPSKCMNCGHRLSPADLIPLFGWFMCKGRCRYCGEPVSFLYPAVEFATGVLFAALPFLSPDPKELLVAYPMTSLLIILTVSDLRYKLLPNKLLYPSMLLFAGLRLLVHPLPYVQYALGFLLGGGMLILVSWGAELLGKPAMGMGDVKLMSLLGLIMGAKLVFICIFLSALLGCIVGTAMILLGKLNRRTFLPYGPFIAAGALLSFWFGNALSDWYVRLLMA